MLPIGKFFDEAERVARSVFQGYSHQILILLLAGCLTTMTGSVALPVFPEMVQQLNLDPRWAGTLVSTHALTSALSTPIMGVLADRLGKLKVMIPCLLLYAVFGVSTAFFTSMPFLLASRGLLGAASGGVAAATIGILGGMYEGEARSRILGFATSAMTIAAIIFPLLGGWVGGIDWHYTFYLYGLGVPLAIAALLGLKESFQSRTMEPQESRSLVKILQNSDILTLYLFIGAAGLIVYSVVVYSPIYLKQTIAATPTLNGLVLAIRLVGAAMISALGASRFARRFGRSGAVAFGFSLMAITLVMFPFLTDLVWIIPTAAIFGAGFGMITPNLYDALASLAPFEFRASVLAIGTGFNSLGQFISPVILGAIWKTSGLPMVFFVAAGVATIACLLSWMKGDRL